MVDKASLGGASAMIESWVRLAKQKIQRMSGAKAETEVLPVASDAALQSQTLFLSPRAVKIFIIVWLVVLFLMILYMNIRISALSSRIKDLEKMTQTLKVSTHTISPPPPSPLPPVIDTSPPTPAPLQGAPG